MHTNALKSIENHIDIALQACSIQDRWPIFDSYEDNVFSLSQEVIKHKKQWLTVWNSYQIFLDHVHSYLERKFSEEKGISGKLIELIDKNEILGLKTSILDFIASVPRNYEIYFPLPYFKYPEISDIQLSNLLRIKKFKEGDTLPGGKVVNYLLAIPGGPKKLDVDTTYVVIKVSGYVGGSIDDLAFTEALSRLKQLLYMCLILNLIKLQRRAISWADVAMTISLGCPTGQAITIDLADPNEISSSVILPSSILSYIEKMTPNTSSKKFIDAKQHGEEGIGTLFKSSLDKTANLIQTNDDNAQFLKSAIEWAFDSQIEENETISFIQVCIGLEAILGEETGRESLTETLADRCAYLLGRSIEKRRKIRGTFRDFYKLRSKLVHGRSMRLKDEEKWVLKWGKNILDGTILQEIERLNL